MKAVHSLTSKIQALPELKFKINQWKFLGKKIVFTNGCFDLLHAGHIASLSAAAEQGDILIVGLNADNSVQKLKGPGRPVNDQESRMTVMASLAMVDAVILFEEDTPLNLIKELRPDVLVKGGDYKVEEIAGSKEVIESGGRVVIIPLKQGFSTTGTINKLKVEQ